ncbi:hypothetical protein T4A_3999 [Trichinella pseudospiralis]|uniref:Secreted protein n=1 Tax=Trichinella pseudospiralis TaxID=6337 RepID=A0A0V1F1F1_TRIPS|nr:hypothetical protein T4A_3999 [Trichinella pseudospiralis]
MSFICVVVVIVVVVAAACGGGGNDDNDDAAFFESSLCFHFDTSMDKFLEKWPNSMYKQQMQAGSSSSTFHYHGCLLWTIGY